MRNLKDIIPICGRTIFKNLGPICPSLLNLVAVPGCFILSHQSLQFMNGEYRIQLIRVFGSNIDFVHDHSSIAINYICIHATGHVDQERTNAMYWIVPIHIFTRNKDHLLIYPHWALTCPCASHFEKLLILRVLSSKGGTNSISDKSKLSWPPSLLSSRH